MSGLSLLCVDCYNCFSLPALERDDVARIAFLCGWLLHLNVLPIKSIIVIVASCGCKAPLFSVDQHDTAHTCSARILL